MSESVMTRDAATQAQVDAAAPLVSTWLSANAGSGKTRVLTDRVARLLLERVDPQHILCLTYTKAAASEMQNRLFARLGKWAMMPDDALRSDLEQLGFERQITTDELANARTLFARAIETPGGLKIQTIHSFCGSILRRFPLEAGVSPQFRELEEREIGRLQLDVLDEMIAQEPAELVRGVLKHAVSQDAMSKMLAEIYKHRSFFQGSYEEAEQGIARVLELEVSAVQQDVYDMACSAGDAALISAVGSAFQGASASYQTFAKTLATVDVSEPSRAGFETLCKLFLYAKDHSSKSRNFPQSNHKKAVEALEGIAGEVHDWMDQVAAARDMSFAIDVFDKTKDLYRFAYVFTARFEAKKQALAALDFDDLIRKTYDLLRDPLVAQWVLFRLDGGIDHVLIDEAQDTSPLQWGVVERLTQEFTAGEGARSDQTRTIFVVGDKKQSIYSFQGADPDAFDQMRKHFKQGIETADNVLHDQSLDYSFRSSQAILRVVDSTFVGARAKGVDLQIFHHAFKTQMPGRVDLWPVIEGEDETEAVNWTAPVDQLPNAHPAVQMGQRIARVIAHMIAHETIPCEIEHSGVYERRPITEGDILILLQRRTTPLFHEIIRACKAQGLNIAGADRLVLANELAVKDTLAVLSFLALPEDDLSLACALKSPLFGWSEQELYDLAYHRPQKGYLWAALRHSEQHSQTLEVLNSLRDMSDYARPYDVIEHILTRFDGRRKLIARLGAEVEDSLDALLSESLAYEQGQVPSLTGFVAWMTGSNTQVKRQLDGQGDAIRVMTVHGAKGLEAPIVFLPETIKRVSKVKQELVASEDMLIWRPRREQQPKVLTDVYDEIIERDTQERLRLLYVAMTRAEKWLIVGAAGDVGDGDESWYNSVKDGMTHAGPYDVSYAGLDVQRVSEHEWGHLKLHKVSRAPVEAFSAAQFEPLQPVKRRAAVTPSDLPGDKVITSLQARPDREHDLHDGQLRLDTGADWGTALHLLLDHLVDVAPEDLAALGLRVLQAHGFEPDMSAHAIADVQGLLLEPTLSSVFHVAANETRLSEVAVSANLPNGARLNGVVDVLIVGKAHVHIVDFKSNAEPPAGKEQVPSGLLAQMGAYVVAIEQIYPEHQVLASILWTRNKNLMGLDVQRLKTALHESLIQLNP